MILLDTHILIWWIDDNPRLSQSHRQIIQARQNDGLGISIYSCWEIAKLVEYGKLELKFSIKDWLEIALSHPNLRTIDLTIQYLEYDAWVEDTRAKIDEAQLEIDRGEGIPLDTAMTQLRAQLHQDLAD
jgi:PIN domain nuclease of toxin-antitoxin system